MQEKTTFIIVFGAKVPRGSGLLNEIIKFNCGRLVFLSSIDSFNAVFEQLLWFFGSFMKFCVKIAFGYGKEHRWMKKKE